MPGYPPVYLELISCFEVAFMTFKSLYLLHEKIAYPFTRSESLASSLMLANPTLRLAVVFVVSFVVPLVFIPVPLLLSSL